MVPGIFNIAPRLGDRHVFTWESLDILNVLTILYLWNKFSEKLKPFWEYTQFLFISNRSNTRPKFAKNWAKAKQHPEAELLLFERCLLTSSLLSSRSNKAYSKKCAKMQVCPFSWVCPLLLIIMKMKIKKRLYRYDIHRLRPRHVHK